MNLRNAMILRTISKAVLVLAGLFVIGYIGSLLYPGIRFKPYKVRVSNVTDSAFTVSWITDEPMVGVVYYSEKDSFLPGPLTWIGKKKAVDDRDVSNAQTECVSEINKKIYKTVDSNFTVSVDEYYCNDVKVTKKGEYYTHHVTVQNLDAEKEYYFRVGDGHISYARGKTKGIEFTEREVPAIDEFSQKTLPVITDIGTPEVAYGTVYTMFYDEDGELRKEIDFDSLVFLKPLKEEASSVILSAVANSTGGWTMDLGNIRKEDGTPIKDLTGSTLEFVPQSKNFVPAKPTSMVAGESEYPISLIGNDDKTWERDSEESIVESSILNNLKKTFYTEISAEEDSAQAVKATTEDPATCPISKTWLWRSASNTCEQACSDNGYSSKGKCEEKGKDNDKDEIVVKGDHIMECFDEDGCVCLYDKQGNNYMVRIDISIGEKCKPSLVCSKRTDPPGKEDTQMGDLCIDPGGCECFVGSNYAQKDAKCGQVCGGEVIDDEDSSVDDEGILDTIPIGVTCNAKDGCICVSDESTMIPVGSVKKGEKCRADAEHYKSLEEVCGDHAKPASVRYTKHGGTGENVLICLALEEYGKYKERCTNGTGAAVFASPDFYLIEDMGNGQYQLGKQEHFIGRLFCPNAYFSLAIEVDSDREIKPQVEEYAKYKCCVTPGQEGIGVLGDIYSFQKDCSVVVDAEKCNVDLKKTYCISEEEPNLLFAVLYPRSNDDKYDNDLSICEEENGEGLRGGGGGYSNETPHYGKNCCEEPKSNFLVDLCTRNAKVQWDNCIDNGKVGQVYDENPIRFNELRPGGGNLYRLPNKFVKSSQAEEVSTAISEDEDINSVFYFPESGMYEIATFDGQTRNVFGDKNTSYFYFKNRDGVPGYQAPKNPDIPEDDEDLIIPRVVAEISISKNTTAREIDLKEGINIVSFDFLPSGGEETLEKLTSSEFLKLANLSGNNISRISYFSGGQWYGGTTYDFKTGEVNGTSFDLSFGKGYVILALRDVTVSIPGYEVENPLPIAFSSGWNLIGVHGYDTTYTAKSFLNSINTIEGLKANNVTYWATSKGMYQGYQLSEGQEYGQDYTITKDLGYFVRINEYTKDECTSVWWNPGGADNGKCGGNI